MRNTPVIVEKGWGREIVFAGPTGPSTGESTAEYSGKLLEFDKTGAAFSMHFHKEKHETWYVLRGAFTLTTINLADAVETTVELVAGEIWTMAPMTPHRLIAREDNSAVVEVSTPDDPEDNYRIAPGDSQEKTDDLAASRL